MYSKTTWVDGGAPGISAAKLNNMENGISDAHTFIDGYNATQTNGNAGYWTLLAEVDITAQYQDMNVIIDFIGQNGSSSDLAKGRIYFRAKQQSAMGSNPNCFLQLENNVNFGSDNIKAVITSATSSRTSVQLWIQNTINYQTIVFAPRLTNGNGSITYYNDHGLQSSIPSGTIINCSDNKVYGNGELVHEGTAQVVTSGNSAQTTITFPTAYTNNPNVQLTITGVSNNDLGYINIRVYSVSPTSVTVRVTSYIDQTIQFNWVAVGT